MGLCLHVFEPRTSDDEDPDEIAECDVDLTTVFGRGRMTLEQLIDLKPGDVVPCDFQGGVTVYAEDVPILRGGFGVSRGQMAVQVTERLIRGRSATANTTAAH